MKHFQLTAHINSGYIIITFTVLIIYMKYQF